MALNTAALDTRIRATVASTMYDMTRVNAKGYFDSADSEEARYQAKAAMNGMRTGRSIRDHYLQIITKQLKQYSGTKQNVRSSVEKYRKAIRRVLTAG